MTSQTTEPQTDFSTTSEKQPQTPAKLVLKYRYTKELGEGSNGKTFLAINRQTGGYVAIKALKLNQSDDFKSFELFKREAETLSTIQVKGVPRFYESILSDNLGEECYIIQEYVDSPSIQTYLDQGRIFTERETVMVLAKVTQILGYLHTQYMPPIIHRDIKPSNILCQIPDKTDWNLEDIHPYLIDFGAVANANSNSDKSTIAGTVGYMAPEQNFGECLPQTDFYALGATALHMLTGKPPYEMDFDTYSICFEKYLDELAPKTSPAMREFLKSMLSYAYNQRPENANALIQRLIDVISGHTAIKKKKENAFTKAINFYTKLSNMLSNAPDPTTYINELYIQNPKCKIARGTVHNIHDGSDIEYTFTVNDKSWAGLTRVPVNAFYSSQSIKSLSDLSNLPKPITSITNPRVICFPCECVVLYHEDDPSCNKLYYLRMPTQSQTTSQAHTENTQLSSLSDCEKLFDTLRRTLAEHN